jgi:hypothetical protein
MWIAGMQLPINISGNAHFLQVHHKDWNAYLRYSVS